MKNIAILGSTGSIGTQTLDIVRANDDLNVVAIAANSNVKLLEEQIREFHPEIVCVYKDDAAKELKTKVRPLFLTVTAKIFWKVSSKKLQWEIDKLHIYSKKVQI